MKHTKKKMRLILTIIFLAAGAFLAAEDETARIVFVTRHAQRGPRAKWPEPDREKQTAGEYLDGKYQPPAGEDSITPLGEKQGALLGAYLKKQYAFNGKVYASPAFRTMQTAFCIVSVIDPSLKIIPEPGLQGLGKRKTPGKGLVSSELERRFPGRVIHADFPEEWQLAGEDAKQLQARMQSFVSALLAREKASQILLVGHSSSLPSLIRALNSLAPDGKTAVSPSADNVLNCCLFVFRFDRENRLIGVSLETDRYFDPSMMTSNFRKLSK